jgi:hypothetical protein
MDNFEEIKPKEEPILKRPRVVKEEVKKPARPMPEKIVPKVEPIFKIPSPVTSPQKQTMVEKIEKI